VQIIFKEMVLRAEEPLKETSGVFLSVVLLLGRKI